MKSYIEFIIGIGKNIAKNCGKIAEICEKTPFFAISVFRPADRNFGRNVSADFDRNFGRNFGFGRTLVKVKPTIDDAEN